MSAETIRFYDAPDAICYAKVFARRCYLHLEMRAWTFGTWRRMARLWPEMVRTLQAVGVKRILAFSDNQQDAKWPRFVTRFGFTPFGRRGGYMLYEFIGGPHE